MPFQALIDHVGQRKNTLFLDRRMEKTIFDMSWGACDGIFPLPVKGQALSWTCDGFFPLPIEEKAVSGLPGYARDCLFPLPVEEKAV